MIKTAKLSLVIGLVALLTVGCSDGPNSLLQSPPDQNSIQLASALHIPSGSSLTSATFTVYMYTAGGGTVTVHRVTAPWEEGTVTYGNFGNAYDPTPITSFASDAPGFKSVDLTGLVQDWLDGTYENYGFILKQAESDLTTFYASEETSPPGRPKLEVCYSTTSGPECFVIQRGLFGEVDDAAIRTTRPETNYGAGSIIFVGTVGDDEKMSLFRFDMEGGDEPASIGDYVWIDANNDGIQDAGEVGYEGAVVHLYNCQGTLLATTLTDATGYYLFDNLVPGPYNIVFELPEGYVFSPQDQGADDAADSDADMATGWAICTTLDPGEHDPTWDAGLYRPEWEGCSLTIGFWKTHAGFGPQDDVVTPLLPITLGDIEVTTAAMAHDILVKKYCGGSSNGIVKLTAQFLGLMLNGANGADLSIVASEIAEAHQVLLDYDCEDWKKNLSRSEKNMVNDLMSTFDDYNNGIIGPGHCDDFGDDD